MAGTHNAQIILVINGLPYVHLKSLKEKEATNREAVIGMSPTGKPIGWTEGPREYDLDVDAYVPKAGDLPWAEITNAVISVIPRDGGIPYVYTGVFVKEVSTSYQEKGQAVRSLTLGALDRIGL